MVTGTGAAFRNRGPGRRNKAKQRLTDKVRKMVQEMKEKRK